MLKTTVLAGVLAAAVAPAAAIAAKPPKPAPPKPAPTNGAAALTLDATPNPVVFSRPLTLSGKLSGTSGTSTIRLEADDTRPYGDSYKPTGLTTTTAPSGTYSFSPKPQKNTQYRVVAQAFPPVTSGARLVLVRPLVGLKVSTLTPRAGSLVRFSGSVRPARNGANVSVQRRSSTGRFVTVKRKALTASSIAGVSVYSVRLRVRSSGSYRVKLPGTLELVNGYSRTLALTTR